MMRSAIRVLASLLTLTTLSLAQASAGGAAGHMVERSTTAMGTALAVRVYSDGHRPDDEIEAAIERAVAEVRRLEGLMTTWQDESDVSRVNAAAGTAPVRVSGEVLTVIRRSLEFSRLSRGAFDISFHALAGLWHFDETPRPVLPDPGEIRRRRALIGWRGIRLDEQKGTVMLARKGMRINLGGIGKGYAVDMASRLLRGAGFPDHIVQAGGDLMLSGSKGGAPWMAGVRDPRGGPSDYFAVCEVRDHAFSTAGDYERSFLLDGKRYHHIIDPRTGYPAQGTRSVTVYAKDATTADGLDDAVFILGAMEGMKLIESVDGAGAVIVDDRNQVHVSRRLRGLVKILRPPTPGL